jgi:hypothetical protein
MALVDDLPDDPSLPPDELGGVDAVLEEEAALLPLVADADDDEDREVVSSAVGGLFAGGRDCSSSATPFSSGKVSGREDSGVPSLLSPLSVTETDGVIFSPILDFSFSLSFFRIVDAFSFPF